MFREYPVTKILSELERDDLLPGILFRTSRRQCDDDIDRLSDARVGQVGGDLQRELERQVQEVIAKYGLQPEVILEHQHYDALLRTATGAHHAGQLLMWRLLLEELMTRNMLRLMIATGTVAAGVDFPARTVVVTAHSKRGAEGFNVLTSAEFQQMSGRAGRRGKDSVGICLVAPGQFSDARVIHQVAMKPPEPLRSAYFASPSSVLNLLKFRSTDDLRYTVSKSLASFLDRKAANKIQLDAEQMKTDLLADGLKDEQKKRAEKRIRRREREAVQLMERQNTQLQLSLEGLEALGHIDEKGLTEKGLWAAELCTSLVLELAEAIHEGLFYEVDETRLAGLVGSIAGDSHRVYYSLAQNPIDKDAYSEMQKCVERVQSKYHGPSSNSEVKVIPEASLTVITWMHAESWNDFAGLLRLNGVAEGDAARVITQAADHLHQISRLKESHPGLAKTAWEARGQLLKPPLTDTIVVG